METNQTINHILDFASEHKVIVAFATLGASLLFVKLIKTRDKHELKLVKEGYNCQTSFGLKTGYSRTITRHDTQQHCSTAIQTPPQPFECSQAQTL